MDEREVAWSLTGGVDPRALELNGALAVRPAHEGSENMESSTTQQSPPAGATGPTPGQWFIDPWHTSVTFSAGRLRYGRVRGQFNVVEGRARVEEDLGASSVEVTVNIGSLDTGVRMRDAHVLSTEFLDAGRFPKMSFSSTSIELDGVEWRVRGRLALHGVSREVELAVHWLGEEDDLFNPGDRIASFSAVTTLRLSDFEVSRGSRLSWGGTLIADDVAVELEVLLNSTDPTPMLNQIPLGC